MDFPQAKRGKLHDFELMAQFAPHTLGGQPKPVTKVVFLPSPGSEASAVFLSCSVDCVRTWTLTADGSILEHVGALEGCKRFTRGYTAAAFGPSQVHGLPQGGAVVAGVASPHEPNQTLFFCNLNCQKVREVEVTGVSGIVSLAMSSSGTLLVGGLCGTAVELSFRQPGLKDGQTVSTMRGHEGEVQVFGMLPDGMVACGSAGSKLISDGKTNACLRIWRHGELLHRFQDHDEFVRCFASCNGVGPCPQTQQLQPVFITGSSDSSWVARQCSGEPCLRNSLPLNWNGERASILSVACIQSGTELQFVTGDDDKPGRMVVWDGRAGLLQTILHPNEVCGLVVHYGTSNQATAPSAKSSASHCPAILSVCKDGFIRVWSRAAPVASRQEAIAEARAGFASAVLEAKKNRLRLQQLQAGGGDANAGASGTVNGVQYQHTMSIALDGSEPGTPPIRIGFNQVDFFKDVALDVAHRHGLDQENTLQLEKAVRAQQEQAAGPPRNLGPPGERERPPTIAPRRFSRICCRTTQRSAGGHDELAKKFASLNKGLQSRGLPGSLDATEAQVIVEGILLLSKTHQFHRTELQPGFLLGTIKMLQNWPPKTLFVPLGILRLASLHPKGCAWLVDLDNLHGCHEVLERIASIFEGGASKLVATSAMLFLVNIFSTQESVLAGKVVCCVSTPRAKSAFSRIVKAILFDSSCSVDVLEYWWSTCFNLTLMLERSIVGACSKDTGLSQKLVTARSAGAPFLEALFNLLKLKDNGSPATQPSHRLQACKVLCNFAASGVIDKQAVQFWDVLGSAKRSIFNSDEDAQGEIDCLLRYREPVCEAF